MVCNLPCVTRVDVPDGHSLPQRRQQGCKGGARKVMKNIPLIKRNRTAPTATGSPGRAVDTAGALARIGESIHMFSTAGCSEFTAVGAGFHGPVETCRPSVSHRLHGAPPQRPPAQRAGRGMY